jgi:hypothetical protein
MLIVMFFLHSLHSHYDALLEQFCSHYKSLEGASLDLIVADACYHNEFKLVGLDHNPLLVKTPKAAATAASSQGDKQGKWNNQYEWLASFNIKGIKKRWTCSLASMGFCLICHQDGDKHLPVNCPLLAKLNLKLVKGPPPAAAPAPVPPGHVTVASPTPGGRSAVADRALASGLSGSGDVPLVLVTTVADDEYNSGDDFCWEGNQYGVGFTGPFAIGCNSNNNVALFPSCLHAVVEVTTPFLVSQDSPSMCPESCTPSLPFVSLLRCHVLSCTLSSIIACMSAASILPGSGCRFTVTDSGATDHMLPDKSAFISYNLVTNLQVRMGNNSYLPVLGQGSAILSLNGQCILVRNRAWWCLYTASALISLSMVVGSLGPQELASSFGFQPLSCWWILSRIATSHMNLQDGLLLLNSSIMSKHGAHLHSTLWNSPPPLRPSKHTRFQL